ncbi:MAG: TIGR03986 family CRISPR-associated RAMP protein [Candidatus Hydrogenedentota bacterium]|nr:MAG: TIGR03986 family CRISPR-associated RAMP protein [Candidatus Hydrogenedentota bacterium]
MSKKKKNKGKQNHGHHGSGRQGGHGSKHKGQKGGHGRGGRPPLQEITAPYNFTPVSSKVATVEKQTYYDLPYQSGVSGKIKIKITAKTPIYIRNGGDWQGLSDEQKHTNNEYLDFFNIRAQYMVPGSSLRGMIRNVFEIVTFSKLHTTDKRYSLRDLRLKLYQNEMKDVRAGFLFRDKNSGRIILEEYKYYEIDHLEFYRTYNGLQIGEEKSTAIEKRRKFLRAKGDDKPIIHFEVNVSKNGAKARISDHGKKKGYVVFTGQPTPNRIQDGGNKKFAKHTEFVLDISSGVQARYEISKDLYQRFSDIHAVSSQRSDDSWDKYYKKWFQEGKKVPVFFLVENKQVRAMGLARLFRLMYPYSPADLRPSAHKESNVDWAENLFGYVRDENETALRSRVFFQHATLAPESKNAKPQETVTGVLSSPKPTFYPAYLDQPGSNGTLSERVENYNTYMRKDAKIRGWKRYPVTKQARKQKIAPPPGMENNRKIQTSFRPLPSGTSFESEIIFHNVQPYELGALLFSLNPGIQNFTHSLGGAKPAGFGAVKIEVKTVEKEDGTSMDIEKVKKEYFVKIKEAIGVEINKQTLQDLLLMGNQEKGESIQQKLSYMPLEDFARSKGSPERRHERKILKKYHEFFK